jgi:GntR family transcriptional repressor for pyruvate dehydrogenase complex
VGRIDGAVDQIKQLITDGRLRPGDKLPVEKDLAGLLGVSRNSVREAVRALTTIRVLDARQGDGTYVTSLKPELLMDTMNFIADLHQDATVLDFLAVRRMLEPEATALAATRIDADALEELARLLAEAEEFAAADNVDHPGMVANDHAFHSLITRSSGNPVLAGVITNMSGQTLRARVWRGLTLEQVAARTVAEHRAIYEALADRDPERSRLRAAVHVAGVEDWLRSALTAGAGPDVPADIAKERPWPDR